MPCAPEIDVYWKKGDIPLAEIVSPPPVGGGRPTERDMRRSVMRLAWPVMAEQVLATITQLVDIAMVGRLGAAAIAAVGISLQPLMLAFSIFGALSVGTTAVVARSIGSGAPREASRALRQSLIVSGLLAAILCLWAYRYAYLVVGIMGPQPDVLELGVGYVRVILPGVIFMMASFSISAALRGAGDTVTPMKVNLAVNVINPILNYIFIFGALGFPAMGVRGAALGTTLVRGAGGIVLLILVIRGPGPLRIAWGDGPAFQRDMILRIVRVGLPAALEQFISRVGQVFFLRVVSGLGTMAYAAHTVAVNAEAISFMPAFGFATAATTLVGQNLGAGDPEMAERSCWTTWKITTVIGGVAALLMLTVPGYMMRIYTNDPEVIAIGTSLLRIVAFAQIPMTTFFVMAGGLRGAGDTRAMLYISTGSVWLVRLLLAQVFTGILGRGIEFVWYAMVLDWFVRGGLAVLRFRSGTWKDIEV